MNATLKLTALLCLLWLTACTGFGKAAATAAPVPSLWTTEWLLEDLGGKEVVDNSQATLAFPEADTVAGNGSCNRFFGTVEIKADTVKFGKLAATRRSCPAEALSRQEADYLEALENAERISMDGADLLIISKGLDKPLRFAPIKPRQP